MANIELDLAKQFFDYIENNVLSGALVYTGDTIVHCVDNTRVIVEKGSSLTRSSIYMAVTSGLDVDISASRLDSLIDYYTTKNLVYSHQRYLQELDSPACNITELYTALGIDNDAASQLYLDTWMTGAVARAMSPGCKFDLMLILTGTQGCGKTTFLQNLCPDKRWFLTDSGVDSEQNNKMKRSKAWIVECGEVSHTFGVKARDLLKQDISEQRDVFRAPYGREIVDRPRHYVMAGTTNDLSFLNDPTGNRRFAVIKIGVDEIDNAWVASNLHSIWTYYLTRYTNGGAYHLTKEEEGLLSTSNQQFTYEDPFRQQIKDITDELDYIRYADLKLQLGLEKVNQNNRDLKLAARIIQELGFESVKDKNGRYFRRVG